MKKRHTNHVLPTPARLSQKALNELTQARVLEFRSAIETGIVTIEQLKDLGARTNTAHSDDYIAGILGGRCCPTKEMTNFIRKECRRPLPGVSKERVRETRSAARALSVKAEDSIRSNKEAHHFAS